MKKILAVDDHEDILNIIKSKLEKNNYIVETLTDSTKVINFIKEFKPDLILLDIMMPKMTGFELCSIIKNDKTLKNIKVVFLTAKDMDFAKSKAKEVNADGFISKPFSPKELLDYVNDMFSKEENK